MDSSLFSCNVWPLVFKAVQKDNKHVPRVLQIRNVFLLSTKLKNTQAWTGELMTASGEERAIPVTSKGKKPSLPFLTNGFI